MESEESLILGYIGLNKEKTQKQAAAHSRFSKLEDIASKAASDSVALTGLNTGYMHLAETSVGMTTQESLLSRVTTPFTYFIFGMVRDYVNRNDSKKTQKDKELTDVLLGLGAAGVDVGANLIKYGAIKYFSGKEVNKSDFLASLASAGFALFFGDAMGITIDTYRDGFDLERKENSRSLFPKNMNSIKKRNITLMSTVMIGYSLNELYKLMF